MGHSTPCPVSVPRSNRDLHRSLCVRVLGPSRPKRRPAGLSQDPPEYNGQCDGEGRPDLFSTTPQSSPPLQPTMESSMCWTRPWPGIRLLLRAPHQPPLRAPPRRALRTLRSSLRV